MPRRGALTEQWDPVAVELLVNGRYAGRPRDADRYEAVRRLTLARHSTGQIADLVGCWPRSVNRIRQRLGMRSLLPVGTNHITRPVAGPTRHKVRTIGQW
jgi:hypothetical protein